MNALLATAALLSAFNLQVSGGESDKPPAVVVAGARAVTTRDANGRIERLTSIPSSSAFARYDRPRATCTFTAPPNGFTLTNGITVPAGTQVTGAYRFVEFRAPTVVTPPSAGDALVLTPDALGKGVRTFSVLCDSRFLRYVQVPITDSLLDPRTQITRLRNGLQLIRPVVAPDPVVASVGGLVTRYPAWLSIRPEAWVPQRSNTTSYRGTLMVLLTTPKRLEFVVDFVPNRDKPSPSFKGIVTCVPTVSPIAAEGSLPARPALPDTAEPGVTGPCTWTPPGPGTVTITARTIHGVTFWADGIAVPEADYVFESLPSTFTVGELVAVNTPP
jgi:hypothetical protein